MKHWRALFAGAAGALVVLAACVGSEQPVTTTPAGGSDAAPAPTTDASAPPSTDAGPQADAGPRSVLSVDLGFDFGCALVSDGTVWCWGDNSYGQIGVSPPGQTALPAQPVPGLTGVKAIAVGGYSACAIKQDASLWCWGENNFWQLGHDPNAASNPLCGAVHCQPAPTQVVGIFALQATVNGANGCAVTTNHTVLCWGKNVDGECGVAASPTELPTVIPNLSSIVSVRIGYEAPNVCGLDTAGVVWCWGRNTFGALGHEPGSIASDLTYANGMYNSTPQKVQLDGGTFDDVIDVVAGAGTCAVRSEGSVWCWGRNTGNFQTAARADDAGHASPVQVKTVTGATNIAIGNPACALTSSGAVYCWGAGTGNVSPGTLYDGGCATPTGGPAACADPALVPGPLLTMIDVDHVSAAGITVDGGVPVSWGQNSTTGRLGHDVLDGGGDAQGDQIPAPIENLP